ncbi:MAG: c-type cytochrome [Bacteroidota bacterium]
MNKHEGFTVLELPMLFSDNYKYLKNKCLTYFYSSETSMISSIRLINYKEKARMNYLWNILRPFCFFFLLWSAFGCAKDRNHPGYAYFPDMAYSNAYETYSENPNFDNGKTMRLPAEGAISRTASLYSLEKTDENLSLAGKNFSNPLSVKEKILNSGARNYSVFCASCHGNKGDGQGFLYTSGKYPFPPASLVTDKVKERPDGEIFHIITMGYGIMGAHGPLLQPSKRWEIIHYMRENLQKEN